MLAAWGKSVLKPFTHWVARARSTLRSAEEQPSAGPSFARDGFLGPFSLFTPAQCRLILRHVRHGDRPPLVEGTKDTALTDRFFYDLATRPTLLNRLTPLLGEHIVLWGVSLIERGPGANHPWHTDIETSARGGGFVSVWIGLENTSRESALQLITRSHGFGKPIQQVVHEHGMRRGQASNDDVLRWARDCDPRAAFVQPDMSDGQAILFDGRLWHATLNTRREGTRAALLLQYAAADTPIFAPDFNQLEWPFRMTDRRVPCVLVCGEDKSGEERLLPIPVAGPEVEPIATHALSFPLPFAEDRETRFRSHHFFRGATPIVEVINCHMSVLSEGHSPHLPHAHVEEALLIVLEGEAEILLSDGPALDGARIERLRAGSFAFHPAYQYHTVRNACAAPVTYVVMSWRAAPVEVDRPLGSQCFDLGDLSATAEAEPFTMRLVFEHATGYLGKLHAHVSNLQPGAGYPPHADDYDVAILVLGGKVETLDRIVEPLGVVFYAAGQMHGMKNVGQVPARYLVFEFHRFSSSSYAGAVTP
jgi:quercetin dioxygenase-like cupin family protein